MNGRYAMTLNQSRRDFLKSSAVAATASAAGVAAPGTAAAYTQADIRWDKAPCRFCGTGCGVMMGVRNERLVAMRCSF